MGSLCDKPIVLFSGQGSQRIGMGGDVWEEAAVKEVCALSSDIFGFDIGALAVQGPQEILNETYHAQAVILTLSLALFSAGKISEIEPGAAVGFSLGQVSALYATGMLPLEETLTFARVRAEAMARAAQAHPGAMCALLGACDEEVQDLCARCAQEEVLVAANYNAPGQIVISGSKEAIERAQTAWSEQGKRSALLATSGAFHSPLMQDAADEVGAYLNTVPFNKPRFPLISNGDACPLKAEEAAEQLADHLTHPVLFQQSVEALLLEGAKTFVEIGYGGVLLGLVKRVDKTSTRIKVEDKKTLQEFLLLQGKCYE